MPSPGHADRARGDLARRLGVPAALLAGVMAVAAARVPLVLAPLRDYDEGVYWMSLRRLGRGDALFGAVFSSQPPFFLAALEPLHLVALDGLTPLRLAMLLWGAVAGLATGWAVWRLTGRRLAGMAALLLISLDPLMDRAAVTLQAESPAMALSLLALALAAEIAVSRRGPRTLLALAVAAGMAGAAAVGTKLLAAPVLPALGILISAPIPGAPSARTRVGAALAGVAAVAIAVGAAFHGVLGPMADQVVGFHLRSRGVDEGGWSPELGDAVARELPALALAALGAAVAGRRRPRATLALLSWSVAGAAAVAVQHPLWPHHAVAMTAPLALLGALVLTPGGTARRPVALRAGALAVAAGAALSGSLAAVALGGDPRATADASTVAALRAALPPGAVVVTDDQALAAAAGLSTPPGLVDTALVRILSGELTSAAVERDISGGQVAGVVFATTRLDHLAGFRAWVAAHLKRVDTLGDGVVLYRPAAASG